MKGECLCLECDTFAAKNCPYEREQEDKNRLRAELEAANQEIERLLRERNNNGAGIGADDKEEGTPDA